MSNCHIYSIIFECDVQKKSASLIFIDSDYMSTTIVPRVYLLIEDKSGTTKLYASTSTTRLPSAHFGGTKLICQLVALLLFFGGVKIKGYTCLLDILHTS